MLLYEDRRLTQRHYNNRKIDTNSYILNLYYPQDSSSCGPIMVPVYDTDGRILVHDSRSARTATLTVTRIAFLL